MSLIFRMIYLLVTSLFKPRLPHIRPLNELNMIVLPNDLDINMHMNNGRYLTICDLTRVDMFIRTGLAKTMLKQKWMPIITEHTMSYKRALKPFQRYKVRMEVSGWDERCFEMLHSFLVAGRVVAEGTSRGVIYSKSDGIIPPETVMKTVEQSIS